jgi:predicted nuclease of predicted toxin-antitoxin system
MRFLVDQCLSAGFAPALSQAGHDAVHLRDLRMERAKDPEVLDVARTQGRVSSLRTPTSAPCSPEPAQPCPR